MKGSYLGTEFNQEEIEKELKSAGANFKKFQYEDLISKTAEFLSNEKAIGWFQGRMEFGPRALGSRSILADPRSDKMQKNLNLKVKFRESDSLSAKVLCQTPLGRKRREPGRSSISIAFSVGNSCGKGRSA